MTDWNPCELDPLDRLIRQKEPIYIYKLNTKRLHLSQSDIHKRALNIHKRA